MKSLLSLGALMRACVMMGALVTGIAFAKDAGPMTGGDSTDDLTAQVVTTTPNPAVCDVSYSLAPGERSVLLCQEKPWLRAGVVQLQSRHEDVDIALIQRMNRLTVFSVINRSTAPVDGVARVEIW